MNDIFGSAKFQNPGILIIHKASTSIVRKSDLVVTKVIKNRCYEIYYEKPRNCLKNSNSLEILSFLVIFSADYKLMVNSEDAKPLN